MKSWCDVIDRSVNILEDGLVIDVYGEGNGRVISLVCSWKLGEDVMDPVEAGINGCGFRALGGCVGILCWRG
jgi:hypothetical protein